MQTVEKDPTSHFKAANLIESVEVKKEDYASGSVDIESILNKYTMKKTQVATVKRKPMENEAAEGHIKDIVVKSKGAAETKISSVNTESILNKYQHITISSVRTEITNMREVEVYKTKVNIEDSRNTSIDGKLKKKIRNQNRKV